MKVWVYVEGPSDVHGLGALWTDWRERLGKQGVGIAILDLANKAQFLRKIGHRAAQKLAEYPRDLVVALPDLYPVEPFRASDYEHNDVRTLSLLQEKAVKKHLTTTFGQREHAASLNMCRFLGRALRHDFEMLLLAASNDLKAFLGTKEDISRRWRQPVEDQNCQHPPKRIVEELFRTKHPKRIAYRDVLHGPQVLGRASGRIESLLFDSNRIVQCPVFKEVLDWIGERTGVPAYKACE